MLAVVSMIVSTLAGLDSVPPVLGKTARVLRLGPVETIRSVTLPYAAPYLFTGVKLAIAYAFIGVIGAEFIMSGTGLGYEIRFAYDNLDNDVMYPLILLILVIAVAVNMSSRTAGNGACGRARERAVMRRTIYADPSLFLVIGLLILWQIMFWLVGRRCACCRRSKQFFISADCCKPHASGATSPRPARPLSSRWRSRSWRDLRSVSRSG